MVLDFIDTNIVIRTVFPFWYMLAWRLKSPNPFGRLCFFPWQFSIGPDGPELPLNLETPVRNPDGFRKATPGSRCSCVPRRSNRMLEVVIISRIKCTAQFGRVFLGWFSWILFFGNPKWKGSLGLACTGEWLQNIAETLPSYCESVLENWDRFRFEYTTRIYSY